MQNIDINQFTTVSSVADGDNVLLARSGGSHGKIRMSLFLNNVKGRIAPEIGSDGIWYIGGNSTGVAAKGKTPQFSFEAGGICYRFSDDESWTLLVPIDELRLDYEILTPQQRAEIKLRFDDLTDEDIDELQQPANDMIAVLQQTNSEIQSNENVRQQQEQQRQTDTAAAVANANDTAEHPTYVGEDNYVYRWNKDTKAYGKTGVYVRGEGFHISVTYTSVAQMNAASTEGLKEGDFALINTGDVENPENAHIYVLQANKTWKFLVDMSGAIGFTGKTPQLFIGSVTTGNPGTQAAASIVENGVDADGNPKYDIHLTIPRGIVFSDLTPEQIAVFQQPANDMIAMLEQTDTDVRENERIRQSNESTRQENENERQTQESDRQSNESIRQENEVARQTAEQARAVAETSREEEFGLLKTNMENTTASALETAQEAQNLADIATGIIFREQELRTDTEAAILPNMLHRWGVIESLTLTFTSLNEDKVEEYMIEFTVTGENFSLTLPEGIRWQNEPEWENGYTYQVSVINGLAVYAGWEGVES